MEVLVENGWELHACQIFIDKFEALISSVEQLARDNPDSFYSHPQFKLLLALRDNCRKKVPKNPDDKQYRLGRTLSRQYSDWRRVKKNDLPPRYRLFFQFRSSAPKAIIYAWFNDDSTLRKDGAKTDVYSVFEKMLKRGNPPTTWDALLAAAKPYPNDANG
jgi:toxin YhaV